MPGTPAPQDPRAVVTTSMRLGQELLAVPRDQRGADW